MNLFRSEEHIRNWARFDPAAEGGIVALADLVQIFSGKLFRRRLDTDYVSRYPEHVGEFMGIVAEFSKTHPFWKLPAT